MTHVLRMEMGSARCRIILSVCETCKELLRLQRSGEALGHLAELQTGVTREYDDLRAYIRTLADVEITRHTAAVENATHISVRAEFGGPAKLVEHVLHIVREGITNVQRHAHARSAAIDVRAADSQLVVRIDDDGVGFPAGTEAPWSIVSRVTELSGWIRISPNDTAGAHIEIGLPLG